MGLLWGSTPQDDMKSLLIGSALLGGKTVGDQIGGIGPAMVPFMQAQQQKQDAAAQINKTVQFLQDKDPLLAQAVSTGTTSPSDAFAAYLRKQQAAAEAAKPKYSLQNINGKLVRVDMNSGQTDQLADYSQPKAPEYKSVGDVLFNTDTQEWVKPPADMVSQQTDYGLQPVWLRDPETKQLRLGVPGKDGSFKLLDTPQGMELLPGVNNVDAGTNFQVQNKKTGEIQSTISKDVSGEQAAKDKGKAITEAQVQLAGARQTANMVQDGVKKLIDDPALEQALGPLDSRLPTIRASTARVEARINQITGQTFMQARQLLKGGGQITDFEGRKAEEAFARLNRAQSREDFTKALTDFNSAVQEGLRKLEAQAKGNFDVDPAAAQPVTAVNPQTGERIVLQNGQWVPVK